MTRVARIDLSHVCTWITRAAIERPDGLVDAVADRLACSPARARALVRQLVSLGWLDAVRHGRRVRHTPGRLRQVVQRYPLAGLDEDLPWSRDFAPFFALPRHVREMAQHAFTELLNNAIDHSGGQSVTVSMRQTPAHLQLLVCDDGRGLFDKVREAFGIEDPAMAMLELAKGRLTSDPARHTGRGLYFTSRLADVFDLHANAVAFQHREWDPLSWKAGRAVRPQGSAIYLAIALDTERTLDEVMRSASLDGAGYGIDRTRLPLRLIQREDAGLESRAQARRVAARLTDFRRAELDFAGIDRIGQGFADELFRVFGRQAPGLALEVHNASPQVRAMIDLARAA